MHSSESPGPAPHAALVTRVFGARPDEYAAAAWSFTYFFCVLGSYYMLRPVREAMAVESGPETIPYLFVGTFVAMLVATPIFGWVASRFPRRVFLPWVYYFFIINILLFWISFSGAIDAGESYVWLSRVFFVWVSVFNLYVVTVFWSFMADIYTREQGRRLFGAISAGGSIGAFLGGIATSMLVTRIGFQNLFPFSALLLLVAVFCITRLRHWVETQHHENGDDTIASSQPLGGSPIAGITHVFRSPYFGAIAIKSIIASLLGTALYMFAADLVQDQIPSADERTRFFSYMNNFTNGFALVGQLLVVRHVVARFGVGASLTLMPVVSIVGFAILAVDPTLAAVAILTVVRRSLGFAFAKPTTDMLYSVVTPEEKYKVKNFIDTSVYRAGDVVATWAIRFLVAALGMTGTAIVMLPFAAVWTGIALWLGKDYRRRDREASVHA
ncbi:MAG: MFS transporter [Gammaproteobacteria bacterium]|nr:MFS transporter [Gammaproteobacteria bacterium]